MLIMDGHDSHVALNVAHMACQVGLDLFTTPSYTSHVLQLLNVNILKPFKTMSIKYYDFWTLIIRGRVMSTRTWLSGCH